MNNIFMLILLLCAPAAFSAQSAGQLAGKYQLDVQDGDIMELRPDGTAVMAGDKTTWAAAGGKLRIGADVMAYTFQGNRLILTMGSIPMAWKRIGAAVKEKDAAPPAKNKAKPGQAAARGAGIKPAREKETPAAGGSAQDEQARQLLTGSAWCSFTYNKVSGTSTTRKVVFRPDGVMTINGGAETYSSGYGGTYSGQSASSGALRWKLENLRLYVDQGGGFQDIGLNASRNSNGSVILQAEGREYSMCN